MRIFDVIRDFFRPLLGYCPECDEYFKYFKEHVNSNYTVNDPIQYTVCSDCAAKMRKMDDHAWFEYHLNN